jgi:hypothetical protein
MKCEGHRVFDFQHIGACKRPNPDDRLLLWTIFTTAGGRTLSTAVDTIQSGVFDPVLAVGPTSLLLLGCWGRFVSAANGVANGRTLDKSEQKCGTSR